MIILLNLQNSIRLLIKAAITGGWNELWMTLEVVNVCYAWENWKTQTKRKERSQSKSQRGQRQRPCNLNEDDIASKGWDFVPGDQKLLHSTMVYGPPKLILTHQNLILWYLIFFILEKIFSLGIIMKKRLRNTDINWQVNCPS